jgi:UDP:flavonoid glycosyltransferase YjiC (YdhE family)
MRCVLFPLSAWEDSHVVRCINLAKELLHAGHEVLFACSEAKADRLEGMLPRDRRFELRTIIDLDQAGFTAGEGRRNPFKWHTRRSLPEFVEAERELFDQFEPDVVIADRRYSAKVSTRIEGISYVHLGYGMYLDFTNAPEAAVNRKAPGTAGEAKVARSIYTSVVEPYNQFLSKQGDYELIDDFFELGQGDLTLLAEFEEFYKVVEDIPRTVHFVGPYRRSTSSTGDLPEKILKVLDSDQPTVVCHYGDMTSHAMLQSLLEGLRNTDFELIVLGQGLDGEIPGPRMDNYHFLPDFDQFDEAELQTLIDRCSVLVSSADPQISYEAIARETPSVVVPVQLEHQYYAYMVKEHDLGARILDDELSAEVLRESIESLVDNTTVRESLQDFRTTLEQYGGLETSVELIEEHVGSP